MQGIWDKWMKFVLFQWWQQLCMAEYIISTPQTAATIGMQHVLVRLNDWLMLYVVARYRWVHYPKERETLLQLNVLSPWRIDVVNTFMGWVNVFFFAYTHIWCWCGHAIFHFEIIVNYIVLYTALLLCLLSPVRCHHLQKCRQRARSGHERQQ